MIFPAALLSDVSGGAPIVVPCSIIGKQRGRLDGRYGLVRHMAVESSQVSPAWHISKRSGPPIIIGGPIPGVPASAAAPQDLKQPNLS